MNYNVELLTEESNKPTFWSGGMATEFTTYSLNIVINCVNSCYAHEIVLSNNTSEITDILVSIIYRN